ncbi:MAG TPA: O-antigen ligase family protein [Sphingomonas sp.]|nr:O-antigen ligase family protein [Sphingomonas sp.]
MIRAIKRRLFPVEAVLPGYRQPKNKNWILTRNTLFFSVLIFISLFYGLLSAIFPVAFYIYMALPIIVIAALVVWALPDREWFPAGLVEWLFWAFLYAQLLWPNYIAIVLPGLPWITINRLFTAPLAAIFLIALAQSAQTRSQLKDILANSRFVTGCFIVVAVLQVVTLVFTQQLAFSVNKLIDAEIQWNLVFFIAAFVFAREGRARKFFTIYPWLITILMIVAVFEWRSSTVLWANSIPSFLHANDEATERMLSGAARASTGIYRVQSIFSTSLNFAEVMALEIPFLLYWIFYAKRVLVRILCVALLPAVFTIILSTDSRLGVVGFFASMIIFTGMYGISRWVRIKGDIVGPAITMFYPFSIALFFVATLVSHRFGAIIWGNGAQQASNEGREAQWASGWPKIGAWPFGNGIGMGAETLGTRNPAGILTIDSYYLVVLLEYGVIGFIAWLGMWIGSAVQATRWSLVDDSEEGRMLPIMATFMLVFVIIKGVLAQDDSHGIVYMMLGMIVGMCWRAKQRQLAGNAVALPAP